MRQELPQSLRTAAPLHRSTLYHYFYGKDKVPGKLEPGNPNDELAYSTCGIVDDLPNLGEQAGEIIVRLEVPTWCAPRGMCPHRNEPRRKFSC